MRYLTQRKNRKLVARNGNQFTTAKVMRGLALESAFLDSFVSQEKITEILGKTTSLVEEGLENIKVPKQFTGTDEEIVIEDAFNQFSQKIKDLPEQQVDRIKIQFCKDVLESVDNASIVVKE